MRKYYWLCMLLCFALLLMGCRAQGGGDEPAMPPDEQTSAPAEQPEEQLKDAGWAIEINDTQQITDEMGLIWNYTLTLYAGKAGGTDTTGNYTGEAVLKIEPDMGSAQALAASEGTQLLAMLFNYHAECESLTFEVFPFSQDKYAEQMGEYNPDNPMAQLDPGEATDFFAIAGAIFNGTQEPISMTISDEDGVKSEVVPGRATTVTVPTEISINGATAYCFFYNTPHPLARAFKGTITGDVP